VARLSRTIALTLVSEAASVAATTWVTRSFAHIYAEPQVDAYFVIRQALGWVLSVGLFGLNVSLPRALARDSSVAERRQHVLGALVLSAPVLALIALIAFVAPSTAARVLLYDTSATNLVAAASLLFCANALFAVAAASLQGLDRFGVLAFFRVVAWGVAPTLVVAIGSGRASMPTILVVWALAIFAVDLVLFAAIYGAIGRDAIVTQPPDAFTAVCRRLFKFGGVRMIGAIAQLSAVAMAPTVVLWSGGAAPTAASFSVAAMFTMLLAPVRLALQPVALTQLAATGRTEAGRRLAIDYFAATVFVAAAATAALGMTADHVVQLWLGERYAAQALVLRLSIAIIGLHFFCYTLEGSLDAEDDRDRRPHAQLVGAASFAIGATIAWRLHAGWHAVLIAQAVAIVVQALLYVVILALRYGLPPRREMIHSALVAVSCVAVGIAGRFAHHGTRSTIVLVVAEAATVIGVLALAQASSVRWPALLLGGLARNKRRESCAASPASSSSTAVPSTPTSSNG
jgi:O-antigen/teichoic acid export membrane protein